MRPTLSSYKGTGWARPARRSPGYASAPGGDGMIGMAPLARPNQGTSSGQKTSALAQGGDGSDRDNPAQGESGSPLVPHVVAGGLGPAPQRAPAAGPHHPD